MVEWVSGYDRLACITHVRFPASENPPISRKSEVQEAENLLHQEGADRRGLVDSHPLHHGKARRKWWLMRLEYFERLKADQMPVVS